MILFWIKFTICTALILIAGKRVAKYGDIIAEKTGLSGLWIGIILVAVATSLPEMFTGVGSIVFVDAPDLTVGNLLGANTYNLLNIALLDFLYKDYPLLSILSSGQILVASLSLIPVAVVAGGIFMASRTYTLSIFHVSIYSIILFTLYLAFTRVIFRFEKDRQVVAEGEKYERLPLKKACIFYGFSAAVIIASGIWLSYIGDELSRILNLKENFVGNIFLGFATSLPEITVSVAALRIGAKELAVANLLGSNLFNMTIIFVDDLLYKKPIFDILTERHIITSLVVILMTIVVIAGMSRRPGNKTRLGLSSYAVVLIIIFILGAYINFIL